MSNKIKNPRVFWIGWIGAALFFGCLIFLIALPYGRYCDSQNANKYYCALYEVLASAYESVEGLIRAREGAAREAEARITELGRLGIGPGPFAAELIPARGPGIANPVKVFSLGGS
jgi:hypothetical protein